MFRGRERPRQRGKELPLGGKTKEARSQTDKRGGRRRGSGEGEEGRLRKVTSSYIPEKRGRTMSIQKKKGGPTPQLGLTQSGVSCESLAGSGVEGFSRKWKRRLGAATQHVQTGG